MFRAIAAATPILSSEDHPVKNRAIRRNQYHGSIAAKLGIFPGKHQGRRWDAIGV